MYIKRHLTHAVRAYRKSFPSVLVTGPRQVGKSTLLKEEFSEIPYVTMDDRLVLQSLTDDPAGFLAIRGTPLIMDEIQRAQEAFIDLKRAIDTDRKNGMYLLSGSQRYRLMKHISDSLAGRIGILEMPGLSMREISGDTCMLPFFPDEVYLKKRRPGQKPGQHALWEMIHRGCMPELYANPDTDWHAYYASYVSTYVERDVRELAQVGDTQAYVQFMTALAARCGMLLNIHDIAKEVGVDDKTAKRWLSVLEASGIICLLRPFSVNVNKRIVKTPKVYFTDTGLVCYLCRWPTAEALMNGAQAGAIFETFVLNEIMKSHYNAGRQPDIFFFRTTNGQEVDLVFYENNKLYPVEVKKTASPNAKDIRHFQTLERAFPDLEIGSGGIICSCEEVLPLEKKHRIIPVHMI